MHTPLRVLLVDDHAIVREGLLRILEGAGAGWQVRAAGDAFEALRLLREAETDVALIDLSMPGMGGLDLIRRVRSEHPQLRVLVLSMHPEEQYALRALKAGAAGYLRKDCAAAELVGAVRKVAAGGAFVSDLLASMAVQGLQRAGVVPWHAQLSDREMEVLRRIAAGERLTDIAAALHLSIKTVSTHKTRIQNKLGLGSTATLIRYAIDKGLAPGAEPARANAAQPEPQADPTG